MDPKIDPLQPHVVYGFTVKTRSYLTNWFKKKKRHVVINIGELLQLDVQVLRCSLQIKAKKKKEHSPRGTNTFILLLHNSINSNLLWLHFRCRLREANGQNAIDHGRFDILVL
jgi:hypothetical protein